MSQTLRGNGGRMKQIAPRTSNFLSTRGLDLKNDAFRAAITVRRYPASFPNLDIRSSTHHPPVTSSFVSLSDKQCRLPHEPILGQSTHCFMLTEP